MTIAQLSALHIIFAWNQHQCHWHILTHFGIAFATFRCWKPFNCIQFETARGQITLMLEPWPSRASWDHEKAEWCAPFEWALKHFSILNTRIMTMFWWSEPPCKTDGMMAWHADAVIAAQLGNYPIIVAYLKESEQPHLFTYKCRMMRAIAKNIHALSWNTCRCLWLRLAKGCSGNASPLAYS